MDKAVGVGILQAGAQLSNDGARAGEAAAGRRAEHGAARRAAALAEEQVAVLVVRGVTAGVEEQLAGLPDVAHDVHAGYQLHGVEWRFPRGIHGEQLHQVRVLQLGERREAPFELRWRAPASQLLEGDLLALDVVLRGEHAPAFAFAEQVKQLVATIRAEALRKLAHAVWNG